MFRTILPQAGAKLTCGIYPPIVSMMADENNNMTQSTDTELERLEAYVDELLRVCERLVQENRTLRAEHAVLMEERARLQEKADMARNKLDATIARLKAMDSE